MLDFGKKVWFIGCWKISWQKMWFIDCGKVWLLISLDFLFFGLCVSDWVSGWLIDWLIDLLISLINRDDGYTVFVPQVKPLSPGEILGKIKDSYDNVLFTTVPLTWYLYLLVF